MSDPRRSVQWSSALQQYLLDRQTPVTLFTHVCILSVSRATFHIIRRSHTKWTEMLR